jgi:hypothetical protein
MSTCIITYGMRFEGNDVNDIGLETMNGPIYVFGAKDRAMKPADETFESGIKFFAGAVANGDRALAGILNGA